MVLKINGVVIDEQAVEEEFSSIKAYHEGLANVCCCHRNDEFRERAREEVVRWVLLNQEAKDRLPRVDRTQLEEAVAAWKQEQYGDMPDAEPVSQADGDGSDGGAELPAYEIALRKQIEQRLRVEGLVATLCEGLVAPTEEEIREYYDTHLELFMTAEEVRASHLIKSMQKAEDREEAFAELRAVRERALSGEDFDELAKAHTDREDKSVDLGFFTQEDLPAEFSLCAFSMRDGEVSPVLVTQYGLHLVKITGRKAAEPRPWEEVKDAAGAMLEQERQAGRVNALVDDLRAKAEVVDEEG